MRDNLVVDVNRDIQFNGVNTGGQDSSEEAVSDEEGGKRRVFSGAAWNLFVVANHRVYYNPLDAV